MQIAALSFSRLQHMITELLNKRKLRFLKKIIYSRILSYT